MNIYQKVAKLRDCVDKLPKDAHNDYHKFFYTSSNTVLSAVKKKMGELGLIVIPSVKWTNVIQTEKGFLTEMWFNYQWVNTEDPKDYFSQTWYAQGKDSNELGPGKAYTYAEKYLFLKLLNIATDGDDPDRTAGKVNKISKPKKEPDDIQDAHFGTKKEYGFISAETKQAIETVMKELSEYIDIDVFNKGVLRGKQLKDLTQVEGEKKLKIYESKLLEQRKK